MITAIVGFKENSSKINSGKQIQDNPIYNKQFKGSSINLKQSKQISFKGNLSSSLGKKITRIAEEIVDSTKGILRKLKVNKELPTTEKPMCLFGQNVANIMNDMNGKLANLADQLKKQKITKSDYDAKVKEVHDYYDPIIDSNPPSSITSGDVRKAQPKSIKHHEDFDTSPNNLDNHSHQVYFGSSGSNVESTGMDDFLNGSHNAGSFDFISNPQGIGSFLSNQNCIFEFVLYPYIAR